MKIRFTGLLFSALLSSYLSAETLPPPVAAGKPEVKIGVVDVQRVILTVEDGKVARQKLEQTIREKEDSFKKQKDELDKLNEEWKSQAALLSEEARFRKQQDFQQKFMNLRNAEMQFQNQVKQEEAQATQKIALNVSKITSEIAQQENFDFVFETSSSGLIYAKNPQDLTERVIQKYNVLPSSAKAAPTGKK